MGIFLEFLYAFLIGGAICAVAQLLIDKTKMTPARILVSYVVAGVFLTAIGVYDYIYELGGAGASVPLTGFGYALVKGTERAVNENGFIGVITGGVTAASAGLASSMIFAFIAALIFKSKRK